MQLQEYCRGDDKCILHIVREVSLLSLDDKTSVLHIYLYHATETNVVVDGVFVCLFINAMRLQSTDSCS